MFLGSMISVNVQKPRIVWLNAFPLSAFAGFSRIMFNAVHVDDVEMLAKWIREKVEDGSEVVSYIRHESTVEALKRLGFPVGQPNQGIYRYLPGDVLIITILKSPVRDGSEVQVKVEDLDMWVVNPLV